jgi:AcrR family transcriptional regulator
MDTSDLPRHRQRGEATRAAILAAARERFAADGYERTTIRAIASDAGADPSLVMRYYGSKDQLFALVADVDLRLPDFGALARSKLGAALVSHFLDRWEDDESLQALMRTAVNRPEATQTLRNVFARQIAPAISKLVADREEAATRAGLVASQLMGIAFTRYVLRLPPVARLKREELLAWVAPTVQRYIAGPGAAGCSARAGRAGIRNAAFRQRPLINRR